MEIKPSILKTHERLAAVNRQFLDYALQTPQCLQAGSYPLLELNDPLFKLQPWPTFIDGQTRSKIKEASLEVLDLIKSLPARLFSNDSEKISRYYGIHRNLADYLLYGVTPQHLANLLSRGDFILTADGMKCVEFNINTNLGGMDLPYWEPRYLSTPVISEFINRNRIHIGNKNLYSVLFAHLVSAASKVYTDSDEINIAFVLAQGIYSPSWNQEEKHFNSLLQTWLSSQKSNLKGNVVICDYLSLEVRGEEVFYKNKRIHHIMEWCQGFVPGSILNAFKKEKVLICNGAVAMLLSTKLNLALLSENKDNELFSAEERAVIEKYIPWTRRITRGETTYEGKKVKLEELIISNRENLVLKPLLGTGGKDIYVGRYTPVEEWQKVVDLALQGNNWSGFSLEYPVTQGKWFALAEKALAVKSWIVQEYVESPTFLYQWGKDGYTEHHTVWGFFIFGDLYAGGWVRVLPAINKSGIINCHQGAKVSVIFEMEP